VFHPQPALKRSNGTPIASVREGSASLPDAGTPSAKQWHVPSADATEALLASRREMMHYPHHRALH